MTGREFGGEDAFRLRAKRDRLFGLWVAQQLGLDAGDALAYAAEVTDADAEGGEREMLAKAIADLAREEAQIDADTVARQLKECENRARQPRAV